MATNTRAAELGEGESAARDLLSWSAVVVLLGLLPGLAAGLVAGRAISHEGIVWLLMAGLGAALGAMAAYPITLMLRVQARTLLCLVQTEQAREAERRAREAA